MVFAFSFIDRSANYVVKYNYDAWGNHKVLDSNGNVNTSSIFIGNINPFRYKGYYYDTETGMYYHEGRYYNPKWCRWLNGDVSSLDPFDINGLNLFRYNSNTFNQIIGYQELENVKTIAISDFNYSFSKIKEFDKPYRRTKFFDTDWPKFFVLSNEGFQLMNWGLSVFKSSYIFDSTESQFVYGSLGNLNTYAGINYKKGIGIKASANVAEFGYEGKIIGFNIDVIAIGITYMYKDGKFEFGIKNGWIGGSISINILELIKLILGGD